MQKSKLPNSRTKCTQPIAEILLHCPKTYCPAGSANTASLVNLLTARRRSAMVEKSLTTVLTTMTVTQASIAKQLKIGLMPQYALNKEMNMKSARKTLSVKIINFAGIPIDSSRKPIQELA